MNEAVNQTCVESLISMLDPSELFRPENKEYTAFRKFDYDEVSLCLFTFQEIAVN